MIKNYSDHSANERTFLAWVRTSMAVVGFGLGAARLGNTPSQIESELLLLLSGELVILIAYSRMALLRRRINQSDELDDSAVAVDTLLVLLVIAMFIMLGMFAWHVV